ncbi:MAG: hypothetical protein ETSY1_24130 [Candidatus Entotheonella factor]|uniref:Uncharacterized protein n=1 Tax=Entotheonella factor TaxID=1429438 RepID=W4LGC7_ENTF1|nr:MAG: hypothetical protein ETSY1_24130 [Candidatus Entotheonella factor]
MHSDRLALMLYEPDMRMTLGIKSTGDRLRVLCGHFQKDTSWPLRMPTALFPIPQRCDTDTNHSSKL